MTVGAPSSAELHARGHWNSDDIEWFLALTFNAVGHRNAVTLSRLECERWHDLATIHEDDGAIAREAVDSDDDDPDGFADRLLERLMNAADESPPEPVIAHFRRALVEWCAMWRARAAEQSESA